MWDAPFMNGMRTFLLRLRAKLGRALRGVLAAWFAILSLGVSLPSSPAKIASSQPFPCQDHRCGCRDADHCWRSCCCLTREQKFAWALEHGVTPPASFFAQQSPSLAKPAGCCAKRRDKIDSAAGRNSVAGRKLGGACGGQVVAMIDAQRCHGEDMSWTVVIPPSLRPSSIVRDLLAEGTGSALAGEPALILCAPSFDPAVPPPRCG
jgi:hypothetical protein